MMEPKMSAGARFILVMSTTSLLLRTVKCVTRCYCNDSSCVSTSYMCKSQLGVCYSQLMITSGGGPAPRAVIKRYSCAESLPTGYTLHESCSSRDENINISGVVSKWPNSKHRTSDDPVCCHTDMCNYESQANRDRLANQGEVRELQIHSDFEGKQNASSRMDVNQPPSMMTSAAQRQHRHTANVERHLWFKAAVVAVPIVGAFILIILAITAARIISRDRQRRHHYCHHHRHHYLHHCHCHHQKHLRHSHNTCCATRDMTSCDCDVIYERSPTTTVCRDCPVRTTHIGGGHILLEHRDVEYQDIEKCWNRIECSLRRQSLCETGNCLLQCASNNNCNTFVQPHRTLGPPFGDGQSGDVCGVQRFL